MLYAANEDGSGEASVLQNSAADKRRDFFWRRGVGEFAAGSATGTGEFALLGPAAEAVEFVAANFYVEVAHGDEAGEGGDFVLRGEDDVGRADWLGKRKFFQFREAFGHAELVVAVDARAGDGFVVGDFGRPLRDGVVAFAAFIETDLYGMDFVEELGGAFDEQIGQAGSGAGVDERDALFVDEFSGVAILLGLKRVAGEVGAEIDVVGAETKGGAEDDFVEDGSRGVDDELGVAGGTDDGGEIAGVDLGDGHDGALAQETAGALGIAVAAPDNVALALEELREERTGSSSAQNEDSHDVRGLYHSRMRECGRRRVA